MDDDFDLRPLVLADIMRPKFPLGFIAVTPGIELTLSPAEIAEALSKHVRGNWGEVCEEDCDANNEALHHGGRLLSVYWNHSRSETFYVITEADRSATTLLLPSEY
jgi:hypothetical protein